MEFVPLLSAMLCSPVEECVEFVPLLSAVLCSPVEDCVEFVPLVSLLEQAVQVKRAAARAIDDVIFFISNLLLLSQPFSWL